MRGVACLQETLHVRCKGLARLHQFLAVRGCQSHVSAPAVLWVFAALTTTILFAARQADVNMGNAVTANTVRYKHACRVALASGRQERCIQQRSPGHCHRRQLQHGTSADICRGPASCWHPYSVKSMGVARRSATSSAAASCSAAGSTTSSRSAHVRACTAVEHEMLSCSTAIPHHAAVL